MRFLQAGLATTRLKVAREEKMSLQGKHARSGSGSPVEKETKQQKPYESPCESAHSPVAEETGPSQRESEAAEAARARLYGAKTQNQAEVNFTGIPLGPSKSAARRIKLTAAVMFNFVKVWIAFCQTSDGAWQPWTAFSPLVAGSYSAPAHWSGASTCCGDRIRPN